MCLTYQNEMPTYVDHVCRKLTTRVYNTMQSQYKKKNKNDFETVVAIYRNAGRPAENVFYPRLMIFSSLVGLSIIRSRV